MFTIAFYASSNMFQHIAYVHIKLMFPILILTIAEAIAMIAIAEAIAIIAIATAIAVQVLYSTHDQSKSGSAHDEIGQ